MQTELELAVKPLGLRLGCRRGRLLIRGLAGNGGEIDEAWQARNQSSAPMILADIVIRNLLQHAQTRAFESHHLQRQWHQTLIAE
jgi:hypothetical protein